MFREEGLANIWLKKQILYPVFNKKVVSFKSEHLETDVKQRLPWMYQ